MKVSHYQPVHLTSVLLLLHSSFIICRHEFWFITKCYILNEQNVWSLLHHHSPEPNDHWNVKFHSWVGCMRERVNIFVIKMTLFQSIKQWAGVRCQVNVVQVGNEGGRTGSQCLQNCSTVVFVESPTWSVSMKSGPWEKTQWTDLRVTASWGVNNSWGDEGQSNWSDPSEELL